MKKRYSVMLLSVVAVLFAACTAQKAASVPPAGRCHFSGTIVYMDLEGGFYGIIGENGKQYDPVNLPDAFKTDGLAVDVIADPLSSGSAGIHMWGEMIRIIEITRGNAE